VFTGKTKPKKTTKKLEVGKKKKVLKRPDSQRAINAGRVCVSSSDLIGALISVSALATSRRGCLLLKMAWISVMPSQNRL